jgi:hypothetical protein
MSTLVVIGYPKSGNTWINYLLAYYLNARYIDLSQEERYLNGDGEPPDYRATDPVQGRNAHDPCSGAINLVCKTHTLPSEIPEEYPKATETYDISKDHPTVMVARDPRDVTVSYFHYRFHRAHLTQETLLYKFTPYSLRDLYLRWRYFDQFAESTAEEWSSFVLDGIEASDLVIKYEQLLESELGEIRQFTNALGLSFALDIAREAAEYCSFSRMQEREQRESTGARAQKDERFFRRGESGQWTEYFGASTLCQFEQHAGAAMQALDYDVNTK